MGKTTAISWTDATFNPWWGCVKVSAGCTHCYAETSSARWGFDIWGKDKPRRFFGQKHWNEPLAWNSRPLWECTCEWRGELRDEDGAVCPACKTTEELFRVNRRVFCASMADVFETHNDPMFQSELDKERQHLAWTIRETVNLDWLLLTKRIEDASRYLSQMFPEGLPDNLWLGTTTEEQKTLDQRLPKLLEIPARVRFLSVEPMLGPVELPHNGPVQWADELHWIICGGESGPKCRPMELQWARDLQADCLAGGIAFFMKQLGGHPDKRHDPTEWPEDLRTQQFPG